MVRTTNVLQVSIIQTKANPNETKTTVANRTPGIEKADKSNAAKQAESKPASETDKNAESKVNFIRETTSSVLELFKKALDITGDVVKAVRESLASGFSIVKSAMGIAKSVTGA